MSAEMSSIVFSVASTLYQSAKRLYRLRDFARALSYCRTQPQRAFLAVVNASDAELESSETSIG